MKKLLLATLFFLNTICSFSQKFPAHISFGGQRQHVQGIAVDTLRHCIYFSFTTRLVKCDMDGNFIASIDRIPGHLGDLTLDAARGILYASLEQKDDQIGRGVADALHMDVTDRDEVSFSIVSINTGRLTTIGMSYDDEDLMSIYDLIDPFTDYKCVVMDTLEHRFGCSGIDGISLGPEPGRTAGDNNSLYVAYGIYGDTTRTDNDHQVIMRFDVTSGRPVYKNRYFVLTGNTTYGVQNMEYDPYTGYLFLAVYKGRKSCWPNHSLFAVDLSKVSYYSRLKGVPYISDTVPMLSLAEIPGTAVPCGWDFPWGSTGFLPMGGGLYYISQNYKRNGANGCKAVLYRWTGNPATPFTETF